MAGMSVDGLVSGLDTTSLITQLLQAEAAPQTALKQRLSASEIAASAYRTVNTSFAGVVSAAETALKPASWTATKASSSATSVAVSAGAGALQGSLSFTVDSLATAHAGVNRNAAWTSATAAYGATQIEVFDGAGASKGTITVGGTGTLADAAAAINASDHGLSAAVVEISPTRFALQVSAKTTGADSKFSLTGSGTFDPTTTGANAVLTIGKGSLGEYTVQSSTNTFSAVMPGASITVTQEAVGKTVTATVAADPEGVAKQMQTLVDAVNNALSTIKTYSSSAPGSTAALKGDYALTSLTGQLLKGVSYAVGVDGSDRSPATVGFELTKDGKVTFDKAAFLSALADDPTLAQRMVAGADAGTDADGNAVPAVTGLAARILDVAKAASDSTKGTLVNLAKGQDSIGKDLKDRIEAWDLRLQIRKQTLTRQFTAMETALQSLQNQSTWLAGQLNSLPSGG
jgi:flagellar capping protein FliD